LDWLVPRSGAKETFGQMRNHASSRFRRNEFEEATTSSGNPMRCIAASFISRWGFGMTAIVYSFIPPSARVSDLALLTVVSLGGLVLTLVLARLGLDVGAGIPG
jgi:hypothetical protein